MLMLFESLCKMCISMFSLWIWKKINKILKSHVHHIYVAYETVGLSSCRTIELSDYQSDPLMEVPTSTKGHNSVITKNLSILN